MDTQICPSCKIRVFPMTDGFCPSCRNQVFEARTVPATVATDQSTAVQSVDVAEAQPEVQTPTVPVFNTLFQGFLIGEMIGICLSVIWRDSVSVRGLLIASGPVGAIFWLAFSFAVASTAHSDMGEAVLLRFVYKSVLILLRFAIFGFLVVVFLFKSLPTPHRDKPLNEREKARVLNRELWKSQK